MLYIIMFGAPVECVHLDLDLDLGLRSRSRLKMSAMPDKKRLHQRVLRTRGRAVFEPVLHEERVVRILR